MAVAAGVGPDAHALDVAGAQRPAPVQQAALDDRGVADEPAAVVIGERVHPAERVLPVGILEVALEDVHEHGAELVEELRVAGRRCGRRGSCVLGG